MATIQQRGTPDNPRYRVLWRLGGTRKGPQQSSTWKDPELAKRAKEIAEAHRHNITKAAVEAAILGIKFDPEEEAKKALIPNVRTFSERWLKSRTRITVGTRNTYQRQLDQWVLPALGNKRLDEVTGTDIASLVEALSVKFGHATVTRYYTVVYGLFAYAVKEKIIDDNPCDRIGFVRDQVDDADDAGDDHVYLERWEYQLLLSKFRPEAQPLVRFLAGTGARISEATAVPVSAAKLAGNPRRKIAPNVRIFRSWKTDAKGGWYLGPTKGRNRRAVALGDHMTNLLAEITADAPGDRLMFPDPDAGGRWDYHDFLRNHWQPAVVAAMRCDQHPPEGGQPTTKANLKGSRCGDNGGLRTVKGGRRGNPCGSLVVRGFNRCGHHMAPAPDTVSTCDCPTRLSRRPTPHDLRHTHVSWLIAQGVQVLVISRRLGHRDTAVTEHVYAGILPEVDAAGGAAFDAMLGDGDDPDVVSDDDVAVIPGGAEADSVQPW